MAVQYHTHEFEIPTATPEEVTEGARSDVAVVPASLGRLSSLAGAGGSTGQVVALQPDNTFGLTDAGAGDMITAQYDPDAVGANAFDFANHSSAFTITGPTLPLPEVFRRKYVDVGTYCQLDDTQPAAARVKAAIAEGAGREVVFTSPTGVGGRAYKMESRSEGRIIVPSNTRVIMEPGAWLDYTSIGDAGPGMRFIEAQGTLDTAYAVTSNVLTGSFTISVNSSDLASMGLTIGSKIILGSDETYVAGGTSGLELAGEILTVLSASGSTITTFEMINDDYPVSQNAKVRRMNPVKNVRIEGVKIEGPGRFSTDTVGDRGIYIIYGQNVHVTGCETSRCDAVGIALDSCIHGTVSYNQVLFEPPGITNTQIQYGVGFFDGCRDIRIVGNSTYGGRHGIVQSESSPLGITRDIEIVGNYIYGTTSHGIATHTNGERIAARFNHLSGVNGGIDIDVRHFETEGNTIRMAAGISSGGVGIQFNYVTEYIRCKGDKIEGGRFGVRLAASDVQFAGSAGPVHIEIEGLQSYRADSKAIEIIYDDTTNPKKGLFIDDLKVVACGGSPAVDIQGTFTEGRLRGADLNRASSAAAAPIVLSGVSDFSLKDIRYSNYTNRPSLAGTNIGVENVEPHGVSAAAARTVNAGGLLPIPTSNVHTVTSNSGTSDDLDGIFAGQIGQRLLLRPTSGHTITLRNNISIGTAGAYPIATNTGANKTLFTSELIFDGTYWRETGQ